MSAKLGSGARFSALVKKIKKEGGAEDPRAVAASIGIKKYGKERMVRMAQKGRKS